MSVSAIGKQFGVSGPALYRYFASRDDLPGYDAHAQRLADAAQAVMNLLLDALRGLGDRTAIPPSQPLTTQLSAWAQLHDLDVVPAIALRAVLIWSRLHGLISLEIAGNFAAMGIDPDDVFEIQLPTLTV